ncbi:hypothetical protein [Lentilactobacillus kosonis]|uniref:Uncharacterized protein n=1 Tax=Lentilactobacillus kosonis TaxID=2810561 RepID=A0A401FM87_9LACO|nr:hypothetical protein [Lentilactobacillus kosonis]GAY73492.1 hypothetical protein NBRC111893_1638 [Lentilactobacillus kosonis]
MTESNRYYQPQNSKDAMRQIEKLFNQYKDAPLTQELMDYHLNLINQLNTDIRQAAQQEAIPERIRSVDSMIAAMQKWQSIRLSGKAYNGKMEHFAFVANNARPKFKRRIHKMKGSSGHRASRH